MQPQTIDIPVWMGILMFIAGIAMTYAMAKYVVHREKKRSANTTESKG